MLLEQTMPLDYFIKPVYPLVVVPLIDGMDEWEVTYATCQLRREGIRVILAGLGSVDGFIKGSHGMQFRPDAQLSKCQVNPAATTLLLTGGTSCVRTLLSSAELLPYLTLAGLSITLTDVPKGFDPPSSWHCRKNSPLPLFISTLVEALV